MPLADANNPKKMRLQNNRLVLPSGSIIKRRGNDGEVVFESTDDRPMWLGEDETGVFVSFAKEATTQPEEIVVTGYWGNDGTFVVTSPTTSAY